MSVAGCNSEARFLFRPHCNCGCAFLNRPFILATWDDGVAGGLGAIPARAKALRTNASSKSSGSRTRSVCTFRNASIDGGEMTLRVNKDALSARREYPFCLRWRPDCGITATDEKGHVWTAPAVQEESDVVRSIRAFTGDLLQLCPLRVQREHPENLPGG